MKFISFPSTVFLPFLGYYCQKHFHSVACQKIIRTYFLFIILLFGWVFFKISNDTVFLSDCSGGVSVVLVDMGIS